MQYGNLLKQLYHNLRQYLTMLIICTVFMFGSALSTLCAPLLIGDLLDQLDSLSLVAIRQQVLILAGVYLFGSITQYIATYLSNTIAFSSAYTLRKKLYRKIEKLPISFYDTTSHGNLVSRYSNDIELISDGLVQGLFSIINGIFLIIGCIVLMARLDPLMCLLVVLSAPITYLIGRFITLRTKKYFNKQASTLGEMNGYAEEIMDELEGVHAYAYDDTAISTYKEKNDTLYAYGLQAQFYGSLSNPSTRLVMNFSYTVVGLVGAYFALQGNFQVGTISSFLLFSNIFARPFNEVTAVLTNIQTALASSERIFQILNLPNEIETYMPVAIHVSDGKVTFDDVSFAYSPTTADVIKHLSLEVSGKQQVAIVGQTGSGKTTLVNLLMRFYDPTKGSISLEGVPITDATRRDVRKHFGMVLQDTFLFEESVYENLSYGMKTVDKQKVEEICKQIGIDTFIKQLPESYDTILTSTISLSEGQKQLFAIARSLLKDPEILILDEATSSIDTRAELQIQHAISLLTNDRTSFVIAHRLSTIQNADVILMMDKGEIVERGTHLELLNKKGAYYQMYMAQFS